MRLASDFAMKLGSLGITKSMLWLTSTLDSAIAYYDPTVDPGRADFQGPVIYLFWHEYISLPFCMRGHCNISMLLSRHRDADWLDCAARYMGFETIRGSTYRGAGVALRSLMRTSRSSNIAITPDGPRGPRRRLAQGSVYLSSQLQMPLVLLGIGYDRPWRLRTWDRFAIPRPGSRGRMVVSPRIQIPHQLDRPALQRYRCQVERLLERLTLEAETWAADGTRKIGQLPFYRKAKPLLTQVELPPEPVAEHPCERSVLPFSTALRDAG
jgi:lysophospholipid acyltransferase (LPLAT)-like uncharacterized protein